MLQRLMAIHIDDRISGDVFRNARGSQQQKPLFSGKKAIPPDAGAESLTA